MQNIRRYAQHIIGIFGVIFAYHLGTLISSGQFIEPVVLCLGLLLIWMGYKQTIYAIAVLIVLMPLDSIQASFTAFSQTPLTLITLFIFIGWIIKNLFQRNKPGNVLSIINIWGWIVGWYAVSLASSMIYDFGLAKSIAQTMFALICLFIMVLAEIQVPKNKNIIINAIAISGIVIIIGLILSISGLMPNIGQSRSGIEKGIMLDRGMNRAMGFIRDPNYTAFYLLLVLPVITYISQTRKHKRVYFIAVEIIIGLSILMTGSRSGFIALLVYYGLYGLSYGAKGFIKIIILTCFIGIIFISQPWFLLGTKQHLLDVFDIGRMAIDNPVIARYSMLQRGMGYFKSNPIIGYGFSVPGAHNTFVDILAVGGLVGAFLFICPFILKLRNKLTLWHKENKRVNVYHMELLLMANIIVMGTTIGTSHEKMLWIIFAILLTE